MRYEFVAESLPGGIPYASFRGKTESGEEITFLVADPEWLRMLTGCPHLTPIAYELCGRLLTEIAESHPAPRLRSVA